MKEPVHYTVAGAAQTLCGRRARKVTPHHYVTCQRCRKFLSNGKVKV